MTTLKIPNVDAPLDAFVSYVTDLNPLLVEHEKFFAQHHPEGKKFAARVVAAGSDVLAKSAKATIEREEAKAATAAQSEAFARARKLAGDVRERGNYIVSELRLREDAKSQTDAHIVRVACGIGLRGSVATQTGLRRLLMVQQEGVKRAADIFREFRQPDFSDRLTTALADLDAAIKKQSKEQMEADTELGVLEIAVEDTALLLERAIRLVNALGDDVPEPLLRGLASLEGRHWRMFVEARTTDAPVAVEPVAEPV